MDSNKPLDQGLIFRTWLPLAASWILMGAELPLLSATIARLEDPTIHLAAYSSIVFPLALVIESPIIMMLTASTALSRDQNSYEKLWKVMTWMSFVLTLLHVAIAFTPFYDTVVELLVKDPEALAKIREPGRIGLQIMTPWTWSIAHRRFHQGVLIRFGKAGVVGWGTGVRLVADAVILFIGFTLAKYQGIVVAGLCFIVLVFLLRHYSPSRLAVFSFITPIVGVLLSAWLLGEAYRAAGDEASARKAFEDYLGRFPPFGPNYHRAFTWMEEHGGAPVVDRPDLP